VGSAGAVRVNVPDENPSILGAFEFPLRFPGQYADKETSLFYNYFRDYDPPTGRYEHSDPIGLDGGLSTYGYALLNPMSFYDPYALWVPPSLPQGLVYGVAGFGDAFLIPELIRDEQPDLQQDRVVRLSL
jgi:RHS repeat-associated protein